MKLNEFILKGLTIDYSGDVDDALLDDKELITQIQLQLTKAGYNIPVDGIFGRLTSEALTEFKKLTQLTEPFKFGKLTAETLIKYQSINDFKILDKPVFRGGIPIFVGMPNNYIQRALNDDDYKQLANQFGLEVAIVKAFISVESNGSGFELKIPAPCPPKCLFEAHIFGKYTGYKYAKDHPDICSYKWNRSLYIGGFKEWLRFYKAYQLDPIAAMKSISLGLGQVMGFNAILVDDDDSMFKRLGQNYNFYGFNDVREWFIEAHLGELHQANQMLNYLKHTGLIDDAQRKDWHSLAKGYNGAGYAQNNYHTKLSNAYNRFKRLGY